jgi:hypothetical protein
MIPQAVEVRLTPEDQPRPGPVSRADAFWLSWNVPPSGFARWTRPLVHGRVHNPAIVFLLSSDAQIIWYHAPKRFTPSSTGVFGGKAS